MLHERWQFEKCVRKSFHERQWPLLAFKTPLTQVKFIDKNVDYAHRIGIADVVVEAFGK
jgi:hypothetical protein